MGLTHPCSTQLVTASQIWGLFWAVFICRAFQGPFVTCAEVCIHSRLHDLQFYTTVFAVLHHHTLTVPRLRLRAACGLAAHHKLMYRMTASNSESLRQKQNN